MPEPADGEIGRLEATVRQLRDTVDKLDGRLPQSEKNGDQKSNVSPLFLTILGAIGTGILAISNSFFQGKQAHTLEEDKLRSNLILKAIESPDAEERKKALTFYVEAGLLTDPEGKIAKIKAENIPQAPQEGRFLKKQQLEEARDYYRLTLARSDAGAGTLLDVIDANRNLTNVELLMARTQNDRETALDNSVKRATDLYKDQENKFNAGTVPRANVLQASQHRTEMEIQLAKERSTHPEPNK